MGNNWEHVRLSRPCVIELFYNKGRNAYKRLVISQTITVVYLTLWDFDRTDVISPRDIKTVFITRTRKFPDVMDDTIVSDY